jgi:hypothetical protein
MKNNFVSRNWKTLLFLITAVILIAFPLAVKGMVAEALMPFMFFAGFLILFYTILRPWGKPVYYIVLTIISVVLFAILFMGGFGFLGGLNITDKSDEDLLWSVGLAFVAGIIAGLAGILKYSKGWQRLVYSGVALSLLAIIILLTCLNAPVLSFSIKTGGWIMMGLQLIITAFLIYIGYIDSKEGRLSKVGLLTVAIIFIIMPLTAIITAHSVTFKDLNDSLEVMRMNFWKSTVTIYAVVDFLIAVIILIAWLRAVRKVNS